MLTAVQDNMGSTPRMNQPSSDDGGAGAVPRFTLIRSIQTEPQASHTHTHTHTHRCFRDGRQFYTLKSTGSDSDLHKDSNWRFFICLLLFLFFVSVHLLFCNDSQPSWLHRIQTHSHLDTDKCIHTHTNTPTHESPVIMTT